MNKYKVSILLRVILLVLVLVERSNSLQMACSYGERGSLTVTCVNATSNFFKLAPYRFDYLDETLKCVNCTLTSLESGAFDISGNQLKTVDIRNSQIKNIWPKAFIGLIFMERLLLSNNPINIIYPEAFSGVRKVKYLELENAVSSLEPHVFQELRLLEVLQLKQNNISELREATFDGLSNLKILDLSFNKLVNVNNSFTPLISLRILKLNNNQILKIYGNEFNALNSLLLLNLENNLIMNFTINIPSSNLLRVLNLAKNRLHTDGLKLGTFSNLNNLEELYLGENIFDKIPPKFFQGLYLLRILDLHDNGITEFSTGSFSGLPHLRALNMSSNNIQFVQVKGRLILHSLEILDLSNNQIKQFDYLSFITKTPRLSSVSLLNNYLPCDSYQEVETLFLEDNIKFEMSSIEPFDKDCKTPNSAQKILENYAKKYEESTGTKSTVVWMIALVTILIALVALLYFVQFSILHRTRFPSANFRILTNLRSSS